MGAALCAESVVLGEGGRHLGALEQHPPDVLVRRVIELSQRLVLGQVELPQIECPSLTRENPAEEHDLDHVDELDFLAHHVPDAGLESGQLYRGTPGHVLLFPGGEPCGDAKSEFGGHCPFRVTRLGDVEPPRLPPFDGFHKGALEPCNVGYLAHHGTSTLCLAAAHDLRLDAEDLQP